MDDQYFGMKELYKVALKATNPMKIGNRQIQAGQPVTYFDNIQIASIAESISPVYAKGGKGNSALVVWQDRNNVTFRLTSGVISNVGLALLTNATVAQPQDGRMAINSAQLLSIDSYGRAIAHHQKISESKPCFCFKYENGIIQNKILPIEVDYQNGIFTFGDQYKNSEVVIDYYFYYEKEKQILVLQKQRFNGMFELQGKFYRKGEQDGLNRTSIFRMPKVRIISNLNIELGTMTSPAVSNFNIVATPYKTEFSDYSVMQIYNLEDDVS